MKPFVTTMLFLTTSLPVAGCAGNPQRLPVGVSVCSAVAQTHGFGIVAAIENRSDRPISRLDVTATFYQDFRYRQYAGFARLKEELDPGQKREVSFIVSEPGTSHPQGQAIRCFMTHIGYLDGTSQDAPPSE
jgi:hypothetical protein